VIPTTTTTTTPTKSKRNYSTLLVRMVCGGLKELRGDWLSGRLSQFRAIQMRMRTFLTVRANETSFWCAVSFLCHLPSHYLQDIEGDGRTYRSCTVLPTDYRIILYHMQTKLNRLMIRRRSTRFWNYPSRFLVIACIKSKPAFLLHEFRW
jgi:hypothetical protein